MPQKPSKTALLWGFVLLIAILAAVVLAAIFVFPRIGLEASLLWTTIVGGIGWLISSTAAQRAEHKRLLAEEKRRLYYEFIDTMIKAFASKDVGKEMEFDKDEWRRWSLRLGLIASDRVIHAWNAARTARIVDDPTPQGQALLLGRWGAFLLEMRKDCGHADSKLIAFDVLSLFVNDLDPHKDLLNK